MVYYNVINLIKMSYLYKKKFVKVEINNSDMKLVKILIKLNIIKYIKKIEKNNKYYLYLTYVNDKPFFTNIYNMYKPSKFTFITLKNLIKLEKTNKSIIILATHKGVITNYEAVHYKCGGLVIAKLWI